MGLDVINNNMVVNGQLSASSFSCPAGAINNAAIAAGAASNYVQATKLENRVTYTLQQSTGDAVQPAVYFGPIIKGTRGGTIGISAAVATIASATTNGVSVDLQRSTAGGAFASVLSSVITITSTAPLTALTPSDGTVTTTTAILNDIFKVVVTTTGSSGTQAKGLIIQVRQYEEPV